MVPPHAHGLVFGVASAAVSALAGLHALALVVAWMLTVACILSGLGKRKRARSLNQGMTGAVHRPSSCRSRSPSRLFCAKPVPIPLSTLSTEYARRRQSCPCPASPQNICLEAVGSIAGGWAVWCFIPIAVFAMCIIAAGHDVELKQHYHRLSLRSPIQPRARRKGKTSSSTPRDARTIFAVSYCYAFCLGGRRASRSAWSPVGHPLPTQAQEWPWLGESGRHLC